MSKNERFGSVWAKWDLHIHTPGTALSDSFVSKDGKEPWEKFFDQIESSDVEVLGITDYFGIENYKQVIHAFPKKYPDSSKVFFPNIEFRLETSVGKSAEEVNIHIIFDNKMELSVIDRFLSQLHTNISERGAYKTCAELLPSEKQRAAISHKEMHRVLQEAFGKDQCYIIGVAANNQGLRADTRSPRKANIADDIERLCDFVFGGPQNRDYFLRTDRYENGEKSPKKPVLSGCDAHSFEEIEKYLGKHLEEEGKYCTWIKALSTFNGLKQVLFEPESRVAIQQIEPDRKDSYNVIKEIVIEEDGPVFGNQTIYLNRNLNTIIGGKSSGKTLLLYYLAKCIDAPQLLRLADSFDIDPYTFPNTSFRVEWADGSMDRTFGDHALNYDDSETSHRITYIPQLYINHLAEKDNRFELDRLIEDILLQDTEYKRAKSTATDRIAAINAELEYSLADMMRLREEGLALGEERKAFGSIEAMDTEIATLEVSLTALKATLTMSEKEMHDYKQTKERMNASEIKKLAIEKAISATDEISAELIAKQRELCGTSGQGNSGGIAARILSKYHVENPAINEVVARLCSRFNDAISDYTAEITALDMKAKLDSETAVHAGLQSELEKFSSKLSKQSGLKPLTDQVERNRKNKRRAQEIDTRSNTVQDEYKAIKTRMADLLKERVRLYVEIAAFINEKKRDIGSGIELFCTLSLPLEKFALDEQVDKRNANTNPVYQSLFRDDESIDFSKLPQFFSDLIRIDRNSLILRDRSQGIPLRQGLHVADVFKGLIEDEFAITYDVTYRGDNLLKMSPGKKGTVLLILFLELSSAQYPIIIDQPEDNLDNRTIYDLLCKMIKEKKSERQIIIVTHNANLVVTTDAENTIVANQTGQEIGPRGQETRFNYINGPIESSFVDGRSSNILRQQGIKQHICDILEGGDEAFALREKKYNH